MIQTPPHPNDYDARYYGVHPIQPPSAEYRGYSPISVPHWSKPLAAWLLEHGQGPYLDVGAAYGHLCRDLNMLIDAQGLRLADGRPATYASAVDWSPHTLLHKVTPMLQAGDARDLPFPDDTFQTVTSLDLLEHFPPAETRQVLEEMVRVGGKEHLQIHLIGWFDPDGPRAEHTDPTHRNFEHFRWYVQQLWDLGCIIEPELQADLTKQPVWVDTDWNGRWLVMRHVG